MCVCCSSVATGGTKQDLTSKHKVATRPSAWGIRPDHSTAVSSHCQHTGAADRVPTHRAIQKHISRLLCQQAQLQQKSFESN